ncbi:unnamed protein product [Linum trigynum]|uniref:Uncharacterized protein n=1 Tax=Linum trigynum TaxID=586398 RepID=A0AAV2F0A5_9ROSI
MPLILGRPFLATVKALIDVNDGTFILRDGEERITFSVGIKSKVHDAKVVDLENEIASGGKPSKASPTSVCVPCDDEVQEIKACTKPEGKKKRAWRERLHQASIQSKDKGKAKMWGQEGNPMELNVGGDKSHPDTVADPISVASSSKA